MSIEIVCLDCGERGQIEKVASRVTHACGSSNVDVWMETPEQLRAVAAASSGPAFVDFMRTGGTQPGMAAPTGQDEDEKRFPGYVGDDPEAGWDEYPGPGPHPNGLNAPVHTDLTPRTPTRPVPGQVNESNTFVYDKHNPGLGYGANPPEPLVAEHHYPNHSTTTPFLGRRKQEEMLEGLPLRGASCPTCRAPETALVPDYRDHAHWFCQSRCGSLANLDRHPETDPFHPGNNTWGEDSFRKDKRVFAGKKNGQIFGRMTVIARTNPGLNLSEVVHLARQSVINYPEA